MKTPCKLATLTLALLSVNALAFDIHNTTDLYLFNSDNGKEHNCPGIIDTTFGKTPTPPIAPHTRVTVQTGEYWCGFVSCATKNAKWVVDDKTTGDGHVSCQEPANYIDPNPAAEGGYATYFGVSLGGQTCGVPSPNAYSCAYNNQTGDLTLNFLKMNQTYSADVLNGKTIVHKQGEAVTIPTPQTYSTGPQYRGINISGMEYDGTFLDAMFQRPDTPDAQYFVEQGMNTVRLPIRAEFAVSTQDHPTESLVPEGVPNDMYLDAVHDTVEKYLNSGLTVILDLHNYMRFCPTGPQHGQRNEPTDDPHNYPEGPYQCKIFNSSQLQYIWGDVLAKKFADLSKNHPGKLIYGIMNEPYSKFNYNDQILKTDQVLALESDAVKAIRKYDTDAPIIMSGNFWDPMHGWDHFVPDEAKAIGDHANGEIFTRQGIIAALVKSGFTQEQASQEMNNNISVEMHQYPDSDFSGRSDQCITPNEFAEKADLGGLSTWIKQNQMKVWLSEFGSANNADCRKDLSYLLDFVNANAYSDTNPKAGGFIGWTAWRANRHGNSGFSNFNYLQIANPSVWGGNGKEGGIVNGPGNKLLEDLFADQNKYLTPLPKE